jgi:hypothetical protein
MNFFNNLLKTIISIQDSPRILFALSSLGLITGSLILERIPLQKIDSQHYLFVFKTVLVVVTCISLVCFILFVFWVCVSLRKTWSQWYRRTDLYWKGKLTKEEMHLYKETIFSCPVGEYRMCMDNVRVGTEIHNKYKEEMRVFKDLKKLHIVSIKDLTENCEQTGFFLIEKGCSSSELESKLLHDYRKQKIKGAVKK